MQLKAAAKPCLCRRQMDRAEARPRLRSGAEDELGEGESPDATRVDVN